MLTTACDQIVELDMLKEIVERMEGIREAKQRSVYNKYNKNINHCFNLQGGEEFKDIKGYEGLYYISNHGRVWSERSHKFLSPATDNHGYNCVVLCKKGDNTTFRVHRLVANAFLGYSSFDVCHKDGNSKNNNIDNLYHGTEKQNMLDRDAHGNTAKGSKHGRATLVEKDVLEIRKLWKEGKHQQVELAKMFNTTRPTIAQIVGRYTWKHI